MKRIAYKMVWMVSVLVMLLINNSISSAQLLQETTAYTESDQNSTDTQQQNDDSQKELWKTTYYTLDLKSIYCGSVYGDHEYVAIKVNGTFVWGPVAMSTGTENISINPISAPSSATIELYIGPYSNSIYRIGKSYKLKDYVDRGEQSYPFTKGKKTYSSYGAYTVTFEVKSGKAASITNKDFKATCYAGIAGQIFEGEDIEDYQLGKRLRGVNVTLKGKGKIQRKKTNSRGYFFFYNLCSGGYTIECKKNGYYTAKEKVTIYNDDDIGEGLFIPMSPK